MKKKTLVIIGVVIVAAILAFVIRFLMQTSDEENGIEYDITGTWKAITYAGEPTDDEYLVFDENSFSHYKGDLSTPAGTSAYTMKGLNITLDDLDRECSVRIISGNNIVVTDSQSTVEWRLIRVAGVGDAATADNQKTIIGKWTVVMHGEQSVANEIMEFTATHFADYRDGSSEPFAEADYTWNSEGILCVESLGKTLEVYPITDDLTVLVDGELGVWELTRAK